MRNFLTKIFWSHGTSLGSPGSLSQGNVIPGFCRFQILVIWGPYESPVLVACPCHSKSLKTAGAPCDMDLDALWCVESWDQTLI